MKVVKDTSAKEKFLQELQELVNKYGEQQAREYLRTYCQVIMEDSTVSDKVKEEIKSLVKFINNAAN